MSVSEDTQRSVYPLSSERRCEIIASHGARGRKALKAIDENRIKKYRDFFVVVGINDEYVVEGDFCTCPDVVFRGGRCWHIIAVEIAEEIGRYERIDLWYQDIWKEE
jgi:predicted nucleic acid-binding Zn finger protein